MEPLNYNRSINCLKIKWSELKCINWIGLYLLIVGNELVFIALFMRYNNIAFIALFSIVGYILFLTIWLMFNNDKLIKVPVFALSPDVRKKLQTEIEKLDWRVERSNQRYLLAEKNGKWLVGSKATFIFDKNNVLINVQNSAGFRGYSPYSFGRNKRITKQMIRLIELVNANNKF